SPGAPAAVAEQHGGPDLGVEDDVVLAHEVEGLGPAVLPPLPPPLGVAAALGPLDRRRPAAEDRVGPDVEALVGLVAPPLQGARHTPAEVAGDRPGLEVV